MVVEGPAEFYERAKSDFLKSLMFDSCPIEEAANLHYATLSASRANVPLTKHDDYIASILADRLLRDEPIISAGARGKQWFAGEGKRLVIRPGEKRLTTGGKKGILGSGWHSSAHTAPQRPVVPLEEVLHRSDWEHPDADKKALALKAMSARPRRGNMGDNEYGISASMVARFHPLEQLNLFTDTSDRSVPGSMRHHRFLYTNAGENAHIADKGMADHETAHLKNGHSSIMGEWALPEHDEGASLGGLYTRGFNKWKKRYREHFGRDPDDDEQAHHQFKNHQMLRNEGVPNDHLFNTIYGKNGEMGKEHLNLDSTKKAMSVVHQADKMGILAHTWGLEMLDPEERADIFMHIVDDPRNPNIPHLGQHGKGFISRMSHQRLSAMHQATTNGPGKVGTQLPDPYIGINHDDTRAGNLPKDKIPHEAWEEALLTMRDANGVSLRDQIAISVANKELVPPKDREQGINFPIADKKGHTVKHDERVYIRGALIDGLKNAHHMTDEQHEQLVDMATKIASNMQRHHARHDALAAHFNPLGALTDWDMKDGVPTDAPKSFAHHAHMAYDDEGGQARSPLSLLYDFHEMFPGIFTSFKDQIQLGGLPEIPDVYTGPEQQRQKQQLSDKFQAGEAGEIPKEGERGRYPTFAREGKERPTTSDQSVELDAYGRALYGQEVPFGTKREHAWSDMGDVDLRVEPGFDFLMGALAKGMFHREEGGLLTLNRQNRLGSHIDTPVPGTTLLRNKVRNVRDESPGHEHTGLGGKTMGAGDLGHYGTKLSKNPATDLVSNYQSDLMLISHLLGLHHSIEGDYTGEQLRALWENPELLLADNAHDYTYDLFGRGKMRAAHLDELGLADIDPSENNFTIYDVEKLKEIVSAGGTIDPRKAAIHHAKDGRDIAEKLYDLSIGGLTEDQTYRVLLENAMASGDPRILRRLEGELNRLIPKEHRPGQLRDSFDVFRSKDQMNQNDMGSGDGWLQRIANVKQHTDWRDGETQYIVGPPPEDLTESWADRIRNELAAGHEVSDAVPGKGESAAERRETLREQLLQQEQLHNSILSDRFDTGQHDSMRKVVDDRMRAKLHQINDSRRVATTMGKGIMAYLKHVSGQRNEEDELVHPDLYGMFDEGDNHNRAFVNTAMALKGGMRLAQSMSKAQRGDWAASLLKDGIIDQTLANEITHLKTSKRPSSELRLPETQVNNLDAWFENNENATGADLLQAYATGEIGDSERAHAEHPIARIIENVKIGAGRNRRNSDPALAFLSRYLPHSTHTVSPMSGERLPHSKVVGGKRKMTGAQDISNIAHNSVGRKGIRWGQTRVGDFPETLDIKGAIHSLVDGGDSIGNVSMLGELNALQTIINKLNTDMAGHGLSLGMAKDNKRSESLVRDPATCRTRAQKINMVKQMAKVLYSPVKRRVSTNLLHHTDKALDVDNYTNLQRGTLIDPFSGALSRYMGRACYPEFDVEHDHLTGRPQISKRNASPFNVGLSPVSIPISIPMLQGVNPNLQGYDMDANIQNRYMDAESSGGFIPGMHRSDVPAGELHEITGFDEGGGLIDKSNLAYLTGANDLLKEDEERDKGTPPPIKAMHRIFNLEDLKHLRGFTGDWLVTSWPKNATRVIVNKVGDKVTHYDSEGHGVGLPRDVILGLKEAAAVDFMIDGLWDGKRLQIVDMLKVSDDESQHDHLKDRVRHLRANFDSTDSVAMPAPINTRRADDEGLEAAVQELLEEPDVEQIMLRDAESTYMLGERRHPKWVLYTPSKEVDVIILGKRKGTYRLGIGPIDSNHADKIGNRGVTHGQNAYMEVGTVESSERYSKGDHVTVEVSGVTHQTRDDEDVFTLQTLSIVGESETEAADSVETLCVLACNEQENVPHTVHVEKSRLRVSFPALGEDVIYKIQQWGDAWALTAPYTTDFTEGDYFIHLAESQRPYWSPLVALMLKGHIKDTEEPKEHVEVEPLANHKKKPKKVDEDQFFKDPELSKSVTTALHLIERVMKEKLTWTGPKGFGLDYASGDVESPRGPTQLTRPSTLPDFAPADRDGEESEEDILDDDSRKRKTRKIATKDGEQAVLEVEGDTATLIVPNDSLDIS